MATPKDIVDEVLSLPLTEKAELVDQLLRSIDGLDAELESEWANESESRINAYEEGKLKLVSLEEVLSKYR